MIKILRGGDVQKKIELYAKSAHDIRIAAPFWGKDAITRLSLPTATKNKGSPYKLICNLESGACNPAPIETLQDDQGWEARTNKRLHAKLYLFSDVAIVGSANPSANGLSLEDEEIQGWHELCVEVRDKTALSELSNWFDDLWVSPVTRKVDEIRLKMAKKQWKTRRTGRPQADSENEVSFLEYARSHPEAVRDRDIFVVTYGDQADAWAAKRFNQVSKERRLPAGYEFYQMASRNSAGPKAGTIALDFNYQQGKPVFAGIWRVPEDALVREARGAILLVKKQTRVLDLRLSSEDKAAIKQMVQRWLATITPGRLKKGGFYELEISKLLTQFDNSHQPDAPP